MLGPLPKLYRFTVAVCALVLFATGGAVMTFLLPYPALIFVGVTVGLVVGAVAAYLLVYAEPQRVRENRLH